jgi:hypothetical protein
MVTVSIFTLRDVIRRVQVQYQTPHNNDSHTSPSTVEDLKDLREYLETQKLQSFHPAREHNKYAIPARDLMAAGAAYANKSGAFKNFQCDTRRAVNKGVSEGAPRAATPESEDEPDMSYHDLGDDTEVGMSDLAMDEEEFPLGTDPERYVAMTLEVIEELSKVGLMFRMNCQTLTFIMNSMTNDFHALPLLLSPDCQCYRHPSNLEAALENFHGCAPLLEHLLADQLGLHLLLAVVLSLLLKAVHAHLHYLNPLYLYPQLKLLFV